MLNARQKAQLIKLYPELAAPAILLHETEKKYAADRLKLDEALKKIEEISNNIQKVKQGDRGEPGIAGKDGKNLVKVVHTVEKAVPGPKGDKGSPGIQGEPGKPADEKAIEDRLTNKIPKTETLVALTVAEVLKQKFPIAAIEGLGKALQALQHNIGTMKRRHQEHGGGVGGGGGMGNFVTKDFAGDGVTTQFVLDYKVGSGGTAILVLLNGQGQEQGTHYSVSGKTITFTTAPLSGDFIHAWHVRS